MARDVVGFVDANLHRVCATVASLSNSGLHEGTAESVSALLGVM
jgi:hypothetical protein